MARSVRKTKPSSSELVGMSAAALAKIEWQFEVYDDLPEAAALLVVDYGFDRAMAAIRSHYGRWAEARAYLEAERQALQSARWGNIR